MELLEVEQPKEKYLNTEEVAERLGISPLTAKQWRYDGYGPPYRRLRGGAKGQVRYLESKVEEWMKEDSNDSYADELSKMPNEDQMDIVWRTLEKKCIHQNIRRY